MSVHVAKVHQVRTVQGAQALAGALQSPGRDRPYVVVSTAAGADRPYIDVELLARDLEGVAEVHLIPTGEVSWAFSQAMPPMTQVYGGASRVYPCGLEWATKPSRSPLRFAFGVDEHGVIADALITDAQGMAVQGGLTLSSVAVERVPARGRVQGIIGGRVFVRLDNGGVATIWPEFVSPGVEAERLAVRDMEVEGHLDRTAGRLDVAGMVRPAREALAAYVLGAQVLVRVASVRKDTIGVELYPGVTANIGPAAAVGSSAADLRLYFSQGHVLLARILEAGLVESSRWRLSPAKADPADDVVEAPSLLPGGPPWLVPLAPAAEHDELEESLVEEVERAATLGPEPPEAPQTTADPALEAMRAERDALTRMVAQLESQRERAVRRLELSKERLRQETQRAARVTSERDGLRQQLLSAAHDGDLFDTKETQFAFELNLAWARRIPKAEKAARPMVAYTLAPGFFSSWEGVEGVDRSKVIDVVVEVLTGLADTAPGRDVHQLRTGEGGNDPYVTRPNGDTCWRASLQTHTAAARRLHYWRRSDRSIELSAIRLHDDFTP